MKKNPILIALFIIFSLSAKSQNGFTININAENLENHTLYLSYYIGGINNLKITDSAIIKNSKETIVFKQSKKIIDGFRVLYLDNKKNKTEIIINNGSILTLKIDNPDLSLTTFINSNINTDYHKATDEIKSKTDRIKKMEILQLSYPNSVVDLYTKFEKIRFQNTNLSDLGKDSLVTSFVNNINWKDKRIILLPNLYTCLNYYTSINEITPDNYKKNAILLLNKIDTSNNLYPIILDWYFKNIEFYESKNLESVYVFLANNYLYPTINLLQKEYGLIKSKATLFTKLPNGSIVPDFTLSDSSGKIHQLSTIYPNHPYTLIAFFDPECSHCKVKMPEISKFFNDKNDVFKISVLNANLENGWQEFIKKADLQNWLNLKSNDTKREYVNKFNTYSNPNFFLINNKGVILSKSNNINILSNLILNN